MKSEVLFVSRIGRIKIRNQKCAFALIKACINITFSNFEVHNAIFYLGSDSIAVLKNARGFKAPRSAEMQVGALVCLVKGFYPCSIRNGNLY